MLESEFSIKISASYLNLDLRNPIIIAPGPLSQNISQIKRAAKTGYGGMVLKSVVGEDKDGNTSMKALRKKSIFARWVYDDEGNPIFHWNGGLDLRRLEDYLSFARKAFQLGKKEGFPLIASFLCHLPKDVDEEWKIEEWEYTTKKLVEAARIFYEDSPVILEIDLCPFLKREKLAVDKATVLRWYREIPRFVKEISSNVHIVPKLLNLDFGLDFQIEMVKAAKEGNADGVVIANRFFRKYVTKETGEAYFTAHGGRELRVLNQKQIREVRKILDIPICATGGTYSGRHVAEYLKIGAQNVQVLTYVIKNGFEKAFEDLMFNPEDGFVTLILKEKLND
ncbi:TPA: hypothetical protein EYP75_03475 [Candidatus Bathyarchaeota archaeon]|nr:hypothetical protein [Candidatus Bathyarchaeota archaeon]